MRLFGNIFILIITAPVVLLIVIIRPFIHVRFGMMIGQRIGHFTADVEAYLCCRDLEKKGNRTIDFIVCPEPVCNRQLKVMWSRNVKMVQGKFFWNALDRSCRFWTRANKHHVILYNRSSDYKLFPVTETHLRFTEEEHEKGQALLRQLGIPPDASWICIHNRDSAYLETISRNQWTHHNYRDFSIQSLLPAAEEFTRRGFYVLRMGAIVNEQLVSANPNIIDYASSALRSDFADIYLLGGCTAYMGSDAGIATVPIVFRKPVIFVNFSMTLIGLLLTQGCYSYPFITKQLWHKQRKQFMSLREMFEAGLYQASESSKFENAGVEVIDNTAEEIQELSIEIDQLLKSQWQLTAEDEELNERFWNIFQQYAPEDYPAGKSPVRVGVSFLRKHKYLLN